MEIEGSSSRNTIQIQLQQSPPQYPLTVDDNNSSSSTSIDNEKRINDLIDSDNKLRVIGSSSNNISSRILSAPFQPTSSSPTTNANAVVVVLDTNNSSNNNNTTTQLQSRIQAGEEEEEISYQNFQFPPLEKIKQLKFEKVGSMIDYSSSSSCCCIIDIRISTYLTT